MSFSVSRPLIALCLSLLVAGCVLMGDRVLQVDVRVVSETGATLRDCSLGLYSTQNDRLIDAETDIHPKFVSSFVNPPMRGEYYFKISCPDRAGVFVSPTYNFSKGPDFHDFGTVVIEK